MNTFGVLAVFLINCNRLQYHIWKILNFVWWIRRHESILAFWTHSFLCNERCFRHLLRHPFIIIFGTGNCTKCRGTFYFEIPHHFKGESQTINAKLFSVSFLIDVTVLLIERSWILNEIILDGITYGATQIIYCWKQATETNKIIETITKWWFEQCRKMVHIVRLADERFIWNYRIIYEICK